MTGIEARGEIQSKVVDLLSDMTRDWDLEMDGGIGPDTRLIDDLGFESIDLVQLVVAIEEAFKTRGMPYEDVLMEEGGYVTEIKVTQLVDFLEVNVAGATGKA